MKIGFEEICKYIDGDLSKDQANAVANAIKNDPALKEMYLLQNQVNESISTVLLNEVSTNFTLNTVKRLEQERAKVGQFSGVKWILISLVSVTLFSVLIFAVLSAYASPVVAESSKFSLTLPQAFVESISNFSVGSWPVFTMIPLFLFMLVWIDHLVVNAVVPRRKIA